MSRYADVEWLKTEFDEANEISFFYINADSREAFEELKKIVEQAPSIDICFCRECKHRPIKEDADGENYGFNLIEPNDGDERCPCLVSDGWYSWMPEDDFYCGYGEREGE